MGLANAGPITCLISQPKEIMYRKLVIPALAVAALSFSASFAPIAHAAEGLPDVFGQSETSHFSALSVSSIVSTDSLVTQALSSNKEISAPANAKITFERTLVASQPAPPKPKPVEEPVAPATSDDRQPADTDPVTSSDGPQDVSGQATTAGLAPWQISQLNAQKNYIATQVEVPYAANPPSQAKGAELVKIAKSHLGVPYVWGGTSPVDGWDCSGYVQWVFKQAGIQLPRVSQWVNETKIDPKDALPGDLVVQDNGTHVGIYIGNGKMYSALNPSVGTLEHPTSIMKADYYRIS